MVDFISEGGYSDLDNDNHSLAFEYSDSKKALYGFFNEKCNADYDISIKPQFGHCVTDGELNYTTHVGNFFEKGTLADSYYWQDNDGKIDNDCWAVLGSLGYHNSILSPYHSKEDADEECTPYKVSTFLKPADSTVGTILYHPTTGWVIYQYKIDPESIKIEGDTVSFCTGDTVSFSTEREIQSINEKNGKVEVNIKRKYTWW